MATSSSTTIVKFADDTVIMGLILDNDERAYLEEIKHLKNWCQENVSKTMELIVDSSKTQEQHYQPVRISGTTVEIVNSFSHSSTRLTRRELLTSPCAGANSTTCMEIPGEQADMREGLGSIPTLGPPPPQTCVCAVGCVSMHVYAVCQLLVAFKIALKVWALERSPVL
ncbi:hypothetical protein P4O66_009847, partial [Electrophorus voltai]